MNNSNATQSTETLISYLQMQDISAADLILSSHILAEATQANRCEPNKVCYLLYVCVLKALYKIFTAIIVLKLIVILYHLNYMCFLLFHRVNNCLCAWHVAIITVRN